MTDVLVLPEFNKPWVLGVVDGEVVRLPFSAAGGCGRTYQTLHVHCGGMKDKPVEIKRMQRRYDQEARLNKGTRP